jgi:hypothetical protein
MKLLKSQEKQKKFEPYVLTNGDTLKQLAEVAISIYKTNQMVQPIRTCLLLFDLYPDIQKLTI